MKFKIQNPKFKIQKIAFIVLSFLCFELGIWNLQFGTSAQAQTGSINIANSCLFVDNNGNIFTCKGTNKYYPRSNDSTIRINSGLYASRPATIKNIYYATDSSKWYYYNGSATKELGGGGGATGPQGPQGIQGPQGDQGNQGIQGIQGIQGNIGNNGTDGKQIELQKGTTYIQWRYVGDVSWINLVLLTDLKGDQGIQGIKGDNGSQGIQGIQGNAGTNGTNGTNGTSNYTISVQALTSSPTDAQTVYFGNMPKAPVTTAATSKVYIPKAGTIKGAEIYVYSGTAGTNESWSLYVRLNNTTDYLIQTLSVSASERRFTNSALSITVNAGDYIEIKGIQPTWATNPLTTIYGGQIYIE